MIANDTIDAEDTSIFASIFNNLTTVSIFLEFNKIICFHFMATVIELGI